MTEDRRAALAERLAAARARQAEAARAAAQAELKRDLAPALDALAAAGEDFELRPLDTLTGWLPRWIGWGWGEIPWHLARTPHLEKPGSAPAARADAARVMLSDLADGAAPVLFVYEDVWTAIRLSRDAALRQMEALMAVAPKYGEMWLLAPPADFIIRVDDEWVISHVATPLPPEEVERQRTANREGRRALAPLRRVLAEAGVRIRLRYAYDLVSARETRTGPPQIDRKRMTPALSIAVPEDKARDAAIREFIGTRLAPDALLRIVLPGEVPNVLIPRSAFDAHIDSILRACERPVWFCADEASWVLEVGPVWIYGYGQGGPARRSPHA